MIWVFFFSERITGVYFSIHNSSNKGIPHTELGTTGSLWIPHLCLCRFVFVSENYTSHKYGENFKRKFKSIFLLWDRILYSIRWSMWNVLCRRGYTEFTEIYLIVSAPGVLELKTCATSPGNIFIYYKITDDFSHKLSREKMKN